MRFNDRAKPGHQAGIRTLGITRQGQRYRIPTDDPAQPAVDWALGAFCITGAVDAHRTIV